jgi:glycosyltransferase involved in cell wall biosynthesis
MPERAKGLVSIIVPVYNAERFLAEAIESVVAQSYPHWELLLVDDGSSDRSQEIAREFAEADPERIFCPEHPGHRNFGMCTTRNLGVRHSRGEFVALLDADDVWLPNKLQEQLELMQTNPQAQLIYGHSIYFDEGGGRDSERTPRLAPGEKLYQPPELLKLSRPFGVAEAPCPSSFLMRYELLEMVGGFEESFDPVSLYEDQAFLTKVYLEAPVYVGSASWDRYRCHEASCWHRGLRDNTEVRRREVYLRWLERYLRERNVDDPEIWRAMKRLTLPMRYPKLAGMARGLRGAARQMLRKTRETPKI